MTLENYTSCELFDREESPGSDKVIHHILSKTKHDHGSEMSLTQCSLGPLSYMIPLKNPTATFTFVRGHFVYTWWDQKLSFKRCLIAIQYAGNRANLIFFFILTRLKTTLLGLLRAYTRGHAVPWKHLSKFALLKPDTE